MTTRETLEAARDLIRDEKNWANCARGGYLSNGPHCTIMALEKATNGAGVVGTGHYDALVALIPPKSGGLGAWNDSHIHAEVIELFNLAIANELAKESHNRHMAEERERDLAEDSNAPLVFA